MNRVIVTDADYISAFRITRSLGEKGIEVITSDDKKIALSYFSKYSSGHFIYPNPVEKPKEFINVLKEKSLFFNPVLLMPVGLETTSTIAKYQSEFDNIVKLPLPLWEDYEKAYDKFKTFQIAKEIGIPIPKTFIFENSNLFDIVGQLGFPIVVKSRSKSGLVFYANNFEELGKYIKYISTIDNSSPIIQQFISGYGVGFFGLYDKGKIKVTFSHKRLREYPLSGGASSLRESINIDRVNELGTKLLNSLNWHGVAMVEFKYDERTNDYYLMEVNPKFWGSLALAISAGADFPYYLYKISNGEFINRNLSYKVGVKCRQLLPRDILWFLDSLINRNSVKEFFEFKNTYYDVISTKEILPICYQIFKTFYYIWRDIIWKRLKNV